MKSANLSFNAAVLLSFLGLLLAGATSAQASTQITCGYAGHSHPFLKITHSATAVTGRDLLTTSSTDGSPVRSTFKVLKVVPGPDVYEYDIRMVEKYSVGLLNENPRAESSVPGSNDVRVELRVDLRHPENSDAHVHSRESIRDFSWEPSFMNTRFDSDRSGKIDCQIVRTP